MVQGIADFTRIRPSQNFWRNRKDHCEDLAERAAVADSLVEVVSAE